MLDELLAKSIVWLSVAGVHYQIAHLHSIFGQDWSDSVIELWFSYRDATGGRLGLDLCEPDGSDG